MKYVRGITVFIFICLCVVFIFGKVSAMKKDTTSPVIYAESDEIHVEAGSDEVALLVGLSAIDAQDGDLTEDILIGQISPFVEKGVSNVEYIVFDKSNNVARYERKVHFDNYQSPVFQLTMPLMYKVNGDITISDRLQANDLMTGDISDKMKYSSDIIDQTQEGVYTLYVEVKNEYGDTVQAELPLNIVANNVKQDCIQLSTYLIYTEAGSEVNAAEYIERAMNVKGEEIDPAQVNITAEVDLSRPGSGQYRYELYDTNNNTVAVTFLTIIVTEAETV